MLFDSFSKNNPAREIGYFADRDRLVFFELFRAAFDDAVKNVGGTFDFYFRAARQTVCLSFAGKALVPKLTRAFSHLKIEPVAEPDLKICLWDATSTGRHLPFLLKNLVTLATHLPQLKLRGPRCEIYPFTDENIRTSLHAEDILTTLNLKEKIGVYWVADAEMIPYYETGAPLRMLLNWWFGSLKRQLIHSGAVGTEKGGVLLAGKGGSGKSTTALNCLASSLSYASDDYVIVENDSSPVAHSIYNTAKLNTLKDLERFPQLRNWLVNHEGARAGDEKPMMFVHENQPEKILREIPIKAIVFPRFAAGETIRVEPFSQQKIFREISISTIMQTSGNDVIFTRMIADLVRKLPCYQLVFGENQAQIPDSINKILAENS